MRGYSAREIFSADLTVLFERATILVDRLTDHDEVRCHELARAVGEVLELPPKCVQDGYYGFVEHSWLWVPAPPGVTLTKRLGWPHILDVYAVGQLPQVRLLDCGSTALPHVGWSYRPDSPRTDIDENVVKSLVRAMRQPLRR